MWLWLLTKLPILGPAGTFLKALPWKWILIGIAAALVTFVAWRWIAHQSDLEKKIVAAEVAAEQERAHAAQLEQANLDLSDSYDRLVRAHKAQEDALKGLNEAIVAVRDTASEQKAIFDRHDLQKLAKAKPGLIEDRANRATAARMQEFAEVLQ